MGHSYKTGSQRKLRGDSAEIGVEDDLRVSSATPLKNRRLRTYGVMASSLL